MLRSPSNQNSKFQVKNTEAISAMNVVQFASIPLGKLVLLSIVYFDIVSADRIEDNRSKHSE